MNWVDLVNLRSYRILPPQVAQFNPFSEFVELKTSVGNYNVQEECGIQKISRSITFGRAM